MTKRVLSMLMALIMALSLCVPAFAADEPVSADEPAAEVEAPAAEAEETEAEAEPVEEAVDAPEAAAVDEPEVASVDEPLLVALGVVSKGAHYDLKEAVEAAEKLLPGVQAGTLRSKSFDIAALAAATVTNYAKDPVENDLFKTATGDASKGEDFATVLATAEKYLTGIEGTEVDVDVTEKNVTDVTTELKAFLDGGDHELVDDITTGSISNMTVDALKTWLQTQAVANASKSGSSVSLTISDDMKPVTTDTDWMKTYQSGYLTKLQAAINAVLALEAADEVKYADYKAAVQTALDALALEADAAKPVDADATRLQAAIDKAQAVVDLGVAFVDKYVNINAATELNSLISKATGYQAKETSSVNKFTSTASFWKVNDVIEEIEAKLIEIPSAPTLKVEKVNGVPGAATIDVTLSVKKYPGEKENAVKTDGMEYYMGWEITQQGEEDSKWFKASEQDGDAELTHGTNSKKIDVDTWFKQGSGWTASDAGDRWELAGKITNVGTESNEFAVGDVIVIHFWRHEVGSRNEYVELTDLKTTVEIKAADATVAAPKNEISAASYAGATSSVPALSSSTIIGASPSYSNSYSKETGTITATITDITSDKTHFDFQAVALQNGKAIAVVDNDHISTTTITFSDIDEKLAVGDVTVILQYCDKDNGKDAGAWNAGVWKTVKTDKGEDCSFKITIDPMTKWGSTENVEEILEIAEALVESDYKLNGDGEAEAHTVAEAIGLIKKDAALARGLLTATTPSTATNHNAIADTGGALAELLAVCKYLEVIPADLTEFNDLLDEIQPLIEDGLEEQDGTGTYTFDTLGDLKKVYDYYVTGEGKIEATDVQSAVDAAVEALQDALDGLVKIAEIDKSELEASIKAAEALNEEDYTAESWAALQTALDAAKDVLADEDATQAQLTNAADKLNKAVAALVKDVDADDLAAAIEAAEAAIADPSKYTEESVKAVQDAITAAKALGDDATADEIADAIDKLDAAVKGLVPAEAEPELKEGWNLIEGEYYYCKDGKMVKSDWVKSKGLWYYMDAEGKLLTGLNEISDKYGKAWYFFEDDNSRGTEGRMLTGWVELENAEGAGDWGWFETRSNGHQGQCTYTSTWGDFDGYTKK